MPGDDIYHDAIMALAKAETGAGALDDADASATIDNPLCGDRVRIDIKMDGGAVAAVAHKVRGCALCKAAASVIGARAPGQSTEDLRAVMAATEAMLKASGPEPPDGQWQDIAAFRPVAARKSRHDCVLLPFQALLEALEKADGDAR